jgi:hypothetical protein
MYACKVGRKGPQPVDWETGFDESVHMKYRTVTRRMNRNPSRIRDKAPA